MEIGKGARGNWEMNTFKLGTEHTKPGNGTCENRHVEKNCIQCNSSGVAG